MEISFTPEQEAQLAHIATRKGTNSERLVKNAVLCMLEDQTPFSAPPPELPVFRLGAMKSLHRRDLYGDIR